MTKTLVSIIVLNYNGHNCLVECLRSIVANHFSALEVIVVDNASSDDSLAVAKNYTQTPKTFNIKYLILNTNTGFAKANNYAATQAKGQYLFFLNNDTKIETNTIQSLYGQISRHHNYGIVSCPLYSYDGRTLWQQGIAIDPFGFPLNYQKTFYAEGSALMINKNIFYQLGGFDPDYFMFHEDVDLNWRVRLIGYQVFIDRTTKIYHLAGHASGGQLTKNRYQTTYLRRYYSERNNITTLLKNYSCFSLLLFLPIYLLINFAECIFYLLTGRPKLIYFYGKAYLWNLVNFKSTLKKRKIIQNSRIVSDWQIIKNMYLGFGKIYMLKQVGLPYFQ